MRFRQLLSSRPVPAFQFIQDPLDYMKHTHHTNLDTFERLQREDLVQASIVMATFLWQAAQRDEMLPRKPIPTQPPTAPAAAEPEDRSGAASARAAGGQG